MATLARYLLVSGIAGAMSLSSTSARASHDAAPFAMVIGHGTLLPAYVSVIYYAANPNKRMPAGWVVPNVITSLMAGSLGGLMIELSTYPSPSGDGQLAAPAAVSVVAGSVFVIVRLG